MGNRIYRTDFLKWLIMLVGVMVFGQGCSEQRFSDEQAVPLSLEAPSAYEAPPVDPPVDPNIPIATNGCVVNAGQTCQVKKRVRKDGCPRFNHCVDFQALYYDSPNGCDPSARSFVEYSFDGTSLWLTGRDGHGRDSKNEYIGDASSAARCTTLGAEIEGHYNRIIPNGECQLTSIGGPSAKNYARVVPGTGCSHEVWESAPGGTVQCDGSCAQGSQEF